MSEEGKANHRWYRGSQGGVQLIYLGEMILSRNPLYCWLEASTVLKSSERL